MRETYLSDRSMKIEWSAVATKAITVIVAIGEASWQILGSTWRSVSASSLARLIAVSPEDVRSAIQSTPEYVSAERFQGTIEPKTGAEYGWVSFYAMNKFERIENIFQSLDETANDIIKYMGVGAVLFALGALAKVTHDTRWMLISALPSFVLAIISIAHAARARQPAAGCEPPSVASAFKYASHYGDEHASQAHFLGQWHLACKALQMAVDAKAHRIDLATRYYVWALALLVIPIVAAIGSL
jgi:hypothetical protein